MGTTVRDLAKTDKWRKQLSVLRQTLDRDAIFLKPSEYLRPVRKMLCVCRV